MNCTEVQLFSLSAYGSNLYFFVILHSLHDFPCTPKALATFYFDIENDREDHVSKDDIIPRKSIQTQFICLRSIETSTFSRYNVLYLSSLMK